LAFPGSGLSINVNSINNTTFNLDVIHTSTVGGALNQTHDGTSANNIIITP
jgi:hypothetical protein